MIYMDRNRVAHTHDVLLPPVGVCSGGELHSSHGVHL